MTDTDMVSCEELEYFLSLLSEPFADQEPNWNRLHHEKAQIIQRYSRKLLLRRALIKQRALVRTSVIIQAAVRGWVIRRKSRTKTSWTCKRPGCDSGQASPYKPGKAFCSKRCSGRYSVSFSKRRRVLLADISNGSTPKAPRKRPQCSRCNGFGHYYTTCEQSEIINIPVVHGVVICPNVSVYDNMSGRQII